MKWEDSGYIFHVLFQSSYGGEPQVFKNSGHLLTIDTYILFIWVTENKATGLTLREVLSFNENIITFICENVCRILMQIHKRLFY